MVSFYFQNYISARLLALTTFLKVLACSDFNIKCSVVHISLLAKTIRYPYKAFPCFSKKVINYINLLGPRETV